MNAAHHVWFGCWWRHQANQNHFKLLHGGVKVLDVDNAHQTFNYWITAFPGTASLLRTLEWGSLAVHPVCAQAFYQSCEFVQINNSASSGFELLPKSISANQVQEENCGFAWISPNSDEQAMIYLMRLYSGSLLNTAVLEEPTTEVQALASRPNHKKNFIGANTLCLQIIQMPLQLLCWPTDFWKRHVRVWTCWTNMCHHPWMFCWGGDSYNLVVKCFHLIIALLVGPLGWQIISWRWCVFSSWGMADTSCL